MSMKLFLYSRGLIDMCVLILSFLFMNTLGVIDKL